ncbi:MAG: hypothetical protein ACI9JM_003459, partial [Halioglobus sp.]
METHTIVDWVMEAFIIKGRLTVHRRCCEDEVGTLTPGGGPECLFCGAEGLLYRATTESHYREPLQRATT